MQAAIYVNKEAMDTAIAIKDLDYYSRVSLSDEESTDLSKSAGYYLKNAANINLRTLPQFAKIVLCLRAGTTLPSPFEISMPTNLRGCIFEHAPNLPEHYAEIVTYWSGQPINASDYRAAYFQNPQNEYLIELHGEKGTGGYSLVDSLLSEGIVVSITGIASIIDQLSPDDFIQIVLPVDHEMLGIEADSFRSPQPYSTREEPQYEHLFLKISDIGLSPDPNHILIDILRPELLDYGYWY